MIFYKSTAVVLGLIISLVLLEVTVRILGLGQSLYKFHPQIGFVLRPNVTLKLPANSEGGGRTIRTNSKGLRDTEHTYDKKEGVKRILILGDSFCEALAVDLAQTFFRVMQRKLDSLSLTPAFEVINSGVSGYGQQQELLFYRSEGRKYNPDYVLLVFTPFNDVRNNDREMQVKSYGARNEPYFVLEDGSLVLRNFPAQMGLFERSKFLVRENLRSYTVFWKLIKERQLSRRAMDESAGIPSDYYVFLADYPPEWQRAWGVTHAIIRQLKTDVEADGGQFIVTSVVQDWQIDSQVLQRILVEFPDMGEENWDWEKPNKLLQEICVNENIPFISILENFMILKKLHPEKDYHFPIGHWNAHGHALFAELLSNYFRSLFFEGETSSESIKYQADKSYKPHDIYLSQGAETPTNASKTVAQ